MVTTRVELEVTDDGFGFTLDDPVKGVLDNTTYTLSTGWRDVTDYVVSVSTSRGRNRDLEKFNAGSLTVRLRNESRMFDPLNVSSPFVGEMVPKRYVRVFSDEVQQFHGLVESWRLAYDVSGESVAEVRVVDAFSFLSAQSLDDVFPEELSGARVKRVLDEVGWAEVNNPVSLVTNLVSNPSMEAGSGTVTVRENLVTNPSFEVDATGWDGYFGTGGAGTAARVAGGYVGGYEYRLTWTTASTGGFCSAYTTTNIAATVGKTYTYSVWVKTSAARRIQATINWSTSASAYISTSFGTAVYALANTWTRISVTATAPANTAFIVPNAISDTNFAIGDTFAIDAAMVETSSVVGDYFDGSTAASGDFTYAWSGTAHASTSLQRGVPTSSVSIYRSYAVASTDWSSTGSKSVRIVPDRTNDNASLIWVAGQVNSMAGNGVTFIAGKTYTVKAKLRLTAAQTGTLSADAARQIRVVYNTQTNFTGATIVKSTQAPNAAGVTDHSITFTIPSNAVWCAVELWNGASAGNGDVWWDDLIVVEGTYTGDYFDGNTTDAYNNEYYWTSTPNASPSIWKQTTSIDLGKTLIAAGTYTDTALQHLQLVESSEVGLLFIGKKGELVFKQRNNYSSGYIPVIFADDGTGIQFVNAEVEYGTDLLFNHVEVSYPAGTAVADNTSSQNKYGVISNTVETLLASGSTAQDYASYYVGEYGEPEYRFTSIDVLLNDLSATDVGDMLQLEIGDLVLIRFTPNGVGSPIERYALVTSLDNDVSVDVHRVRVGVSSLDFLGFVLDDAALGIMDSNVLAF